MRRGGSEARSGVRREDREVRVKTATDGRGIVVVMIHEDEDAHVICFGLVPEARGFDRGSGFVCKRCA